MVVKGIKVILLAPGRAMLRRSYQLVFTAILLLCLIIFNRKSRLDDEEEEVSIEPSSAVDISMEMLKLAKSYFATDSISKDQFDQLALQAMDPFTSRHATVIVQVINGSIWVDKSAWKTPYPWDRLRLQFILEQLQLCLSAGLNKDFEFVLVHT